jgi:hypothetical protein
MKKALFSFCLLFITLTKVHAQGSASGLIGYGFEDGYNFGLGVRVGSTLQSKVYVGGTFVYHLGKTESTSGLEVSANVLYIGGELGYDIPASETVTIRPYAGLGLASVMAKVKFNGMGGSGSENRAYVSPGILLQAQTSEKVLLGLDGRYLLLTGENGGSASSFGLFLSLGFRF